MIQRCSHSEQRNLSNGLYCGIREALLPGLLENLLAQHNMGTVQCTDVGYLSMKLGSYCKNKFKKIDLS